MASQTTGDEGETFMRGPKLERTEKRMRLRRTLRMSDSQTLGVCGLGKGKQTKLRRSTSPKK